MNKLGYQRRYRRKLPHLQPENATIFVTFRLAGSIPVNVQERWREERGQLELEWQRIEDTEEQRAVRYAFHQRRFRELEDWLDQSESGPKWLQQPAVARTVYDSLLHRNQRQYRLDAFCVMSNHVHVLFRQLNDEAGRPISLSRIMHSLKTYTSSECNKVLARTGQSF